MKGRDVVARKHRINHLPVGGTVLWWLLLDRLHAPGWVWGATGAILLLVIIGVVVDVWTENERTPEWKP